MLSRALCSHPCSRPSFSLEYLPAGLTTVIALVLELMGQAVKYSRQYIIYIQNSKLEYRSLVGLAKCGTGIVWPNLW